MLGLIIFYILCELFLVLLAVWLTFFISDFYYITKCEYIDIIFGLTPNWFKYNFKMNKFLSWIIPIMLFPIFHLYYIIYLIIWLISLRKD